MAVMTSAGSTLSIATGVPATYDAAGFAAKTFVVVGEITDLGELGKEYATVTHSPVGSRAVQKFKGSYNNGSMQIQMARDTSNAGQVAMKDALNSDADYSFKVALQDLSKIYFVGKVTTFKVAVGSVDQITGSNCTIEISGEIVEV
jgi:hypothetical protein